MGACTRSSHSDRVRASASSSRPSPCVGATLEREPSDVLYGIVARPRRGRTSLRWIAVRARPRARPRRLRRWADACAPRRASERSACAAASSTRAQVEGEIARAEARLAALVTKGADERAAELERVLARARAESLSLIAERGAADRRSRAASAIRRARARGRARAERRARRHAAPRRAAPRRMERGPRARAGDISSTSCSASPSGRSD